MSLSVVLLFFFFFGRMGKLYRGNGEGCAKAGWVHSVYPPENFYCKADQGKMYKQWTQKSLLSILGEFARINTCSNGYKAKHGFTTEVSGWRPIQQFDKEI